MRIREVTLRELRMKLVAPFETSAERTEERRIILTEVVADGAIGWGECVAGEKPFYSPETTDTAWIVMQDFLWPMIRGRGNRRGGRPVGLAGTGSRSQHGEGGAGSGHLGCGGQAEGHAARETSRRYAGRNLRVVFRLGIKDSLDELAAAVKKELAAGYQRIKIKIKPGKELPQVKRLRQEFPGIKLMVDANSAYRMEDWPLLKQLESFYLMMIEQPLGWDDLYGHVELQKKLDTPICLDECIHSEQQARAAILLGACKIFNIKMGRVGGYTVAMRIHDVCEQNGMPVWCGGMLESGIGRAHNIALSTLENFSLPGDVSASRRYWDEDIIEPEVDRSRRRGITIRMPPGPGIGFEPQRDRIEKLTVRKERLV